MTTSYPVKAKSEAPGCVKLLLKDYHLKYGLHKLKHLHSDQEASMMSNAVQDWLVKQGITFTSSPTDTPELNGLAEYTNKWLAHKTVAIMYHSG
jgi:hypothetical protein